MERDAALPSHPAVQRAGHEHRCVSDRVSGFTFLSEVCSGVISSFASFNRARLLLVVRVAAYWKEAVQALLSESARSAEPHMSAERPGTPTPVDTMHTQI